MTESVPSYLTEWGAFYTMVGSAAAGLTGLMFVVLTLITGSGRLVTSKEAISVFSTPTVLHFSVALLVAGILLAPWHVTLYVCVLVAIVGAYGLVHIGLAILEARRMDTYRPDMEDWTWFTALPLVAYGAVCGGGLFMLGDAPRGLCAIAAGTLLLIFVGIRNSWDVVTYISLEQTGGERATQDENKTPPSAAPVDESKQAEANESEPLPSNEPAPMPAVSAETSST